MRTITPQTQGQSNASATKTRTTLFATQFGSSSFFRIVEYYSLSTNGFFSSANDQVQPQTGVRAPVKHR